jgi:dihydropteroate synthase
MSELVLRAGDRELRLEDGRPLIMGVLNATPDSFSDARLVRTLDERVRQAGRLLEDGAHLIDVGGESNVTNRPAVAVAEEIERVVPLIERIVAEFGAVVSVDTYKAPVAEAAVAAGARMINDISGLADPALADVAARRGAALVIMHTPVAPKQQSLDELRFEDIGAEVASWLGGRMAIALDRGVSPEQIVLDPGPDFGKTPAQTVALLRDLPTLQTLGRPLLMAVSRKDFVGAIVQRRPRERLAGTLAAIAAVTDLGGHILRVHDVAEVADFLAVRAVMDGDVELDAGARVAEGLRREPVDSKADAA